MLHIHSLRNSGTQRREALLAGEREVGLVKHGERRGQGRCVNRHAQVSEIKHVRDPIGHHEADQIQSGQQQVPLCLHESSGKRRMC